MVVLIRLGNVEDDWVLMCLGFGLGVVGVKVRGRIWVVGFGVANEECAVEKV